MNADDFFSDLSIQFPKVAANFEPEDEVHYKMERFASYTIDQIKENNIEALKSCFNFIESQLEIVNHEIENALNVSYCETLIGYDDSKRKIDFKKLMPKKLLLFYIDYKKYFNSLK